LASRKGLGTSMLERLMNLEIYKPGKCLILYIRAISSGHITVKDGVCRFSE
jgi:hypothetical protein